MRCREIDAAVGDRESAEMRPIIDDAAAVVELFAGDGIECAKRRVSCVCSSIAASVASCPAGLARILSGRNRKHNAIGHGRRIRHRHGLGNPHRTQRRLFIFDTELESHDAATKPRMRQILQEPAS